MGMGGNRFDHRVSPQNTRIMSIPFSGCWIWTGKLDRHGYGRIFINGKEGFVHRHAWRQHRGDHGPLFVLHKCDVPACCNPDHLFLGTQQDNLADMLRKGRHKKRGPTVRRRVAR